MRDDTAPYKGSQSPWGEVQTLEPVAEGIIIVNTAGHGGVWLSPERRRKMPADYVRTNWLGSQTWWEEDCDFSLVLDTFPDEFRAAGYQVDGEHATRRKNFISGYVRKRA